MLTINPEHANCPSGLDQVLQFSNVARPILVREAFERSRVDGTNLLARRCGKAVDEILGQQDNIFPALAEWGHRNEKDVQPLVQVQTKRGGEHGPGKRRSLRGCR